MTYFIAIQDITNGLRLVELRGCASFEEAKTHANTRYCVTGDVHSVTVLEVRQASTLIGVRRKWDNDFAAAETRHGRPVPAPDEIAARAAEVRAMRTGPSED